jgi:hypothetical protein
MVENRTPLISQPPGSSTVAESGFQTPVMDENSTKLTSQPSGSTTAADRLDVQRRRIIRQALAMRSPYIPYDDKTLFNCSADVKELYNAVIAHGRRSTRRQVSDDSPIVVSYEKYFVSLNELACSMNPCGELRTTVMELGIESIMLRKDKKLKKIVMPLRVAVSFSCLISFFSPTQLKHFFIKHS